MPNKKDIKEETKIHTMKESKRNDVKNAAVPRIIKKFRKSKKLLALKLERNAENNRNRRVSQNVLYTPRKTHKVICPPTPGTSSEMDLLENNDISTNIFYKKFKETRKPVNKAILNFFPQLIEK